MRCSNYRIMGHNKKAYPLNRIESSNVRGSTTQVDLATLPAVSVNFNILAVFTHVIFYSLAC